MIQMLLFFKRIFNFVKFYTLLIFKKENRDVYKKFKQLVRNDSKSEEMKISLLIQNTNDILNYCNKNVKYYRNIFKSIDFNTNINGNIDIKSLSELKKIPILTKNKIRENFKDLQSDEIDKFNVKKNSSGGSTGDKTIFLQDVNRLISRANNMFYKYNIGIKPWQGIHLLLWGSTRDIGNPTIPNSIFYHLIKSNQVVLNSYSLTNLEFLKVSKILSKVAFDYIRGYSQSLFLLAKYINKNSFPIKKQKIVISTAATLDDEMRMEIEKAFQCRVVDLYGSREVGQISYEKLDKFNKNIFIERNLVELINNNYNNKETKKIIITTLKNKVMPLIRYDVGDLAYAKDSYNYLDYKNTIGRVTSFLKLENGQIVDGISLNHLFNEFEEISKFQIIQHSYKKIEFKIVSKNKIKQREGVVVEKYFAKIFGKDCNYIWTYLDNIEPTESGKFLYIISKI